MNIVEIAKQGIDLMKQKGADEGQIFVTESEKKEFNVEGGEFTLFRTLFNQGINLITYKNKKKGSYSTNKLDAEALEKSVDMALQAAESAAADEAYGIAPEQSAVSVRKGVFTPDMDQLFERTRELIEDIQTKHPRIVIQQMVVEYNQRHMAFANTNGTACEETTGHYTISLGIAGHEGDRTTSMIGSGVCVEQLDRPFIELGDLAFQIKVAEDQLSVKTLEGKFTGTMILTPACLGDQFLYYITNMVDGSVILDKTSVWLDKLGQQVTDPRITISMNPDDKRVVCGETLTDDGFKSEPYDFIRDGVLKSFMLDLYFANKTGYERSKNGAMNFIVTPGEKSIEQIIAETKKGILVGGFSGGRPGTSGEFSGVAKNSFLIEDGKITGAITETMINGNLADMLMHLTGISSEVVSDGSYAVPYMAFDGIVVSGK